MSTYSNTDSARPEDIEALLGRQLETLRLSRNITQAQLAEEAGVSRRTITRLENGKGVSLDTFIRVLRALALTERLVDLVPDVSVSPVQRVRSEGRGRMRARPRHDSTVKPWTWADEPDQ